jgi:putative intracellular protease/amidase
MPSDNFETQGAIPMKRFIRSTAMPFVLAMAATMSWSAPAVARPDPAAKKVAILIFDQVQVIDYSGPLEVLSDAGFDVFTVAATKNPVTTSAGDAVMLTPKYTFADAPQPDLIVIPGGGFEAAKDSETVAWIKRASEHADHTMSVCNGAFTLANTGLLDGKSATTTAGNINRFRQTFPATKVVTDQRVVDNGKILATAGLSAGIDGALHMVDVIKGPGNAESVALEMELDWHPDTALVRGTQADRMIPSIYRALKAQKVADPFDHVMKGDKNRWERTLWYATDQSAADLFAIVKAAYENAYALEGPWAPKSFRLTPSGATAATIAFDDREGHHWKGVISVEQVKGETSQLAMRFAIDRIG